MFDHQFPAVRRSYQAVCGIKKFNFFYVFIKQGKNRVFPACQNFFYIPVIPAEGGKPIR
jgi:hypothetical protein